MYSVLWVLFDFLLEAFLQVFIRHRAVFEQLADRGLHQDVLAHALDQQIVVRLLIKFVFGRVLRQHDAIDHLGQHHLFFFFLVHDRLLLGLAQAQVIFVVALGDGLVIDAGECLAGVRGFLAAGGEQAKADEQHDDAKDGGR